MWREILDRIKIQIQRDMHGNVCGSRFIVLLNFKITTIKCAQILIYVPSADSAPKRIGK